MKIYFEPDKMWFQFWKKPRQLHNGYDYLIIENVVTLIRDIGKGKIISEYEYNK